MHDTTVEKGNHCVYATLPHSTLHTRQSSTQNNKNQVSQEHSYFSWWAHSRPKHVGIDKYTKNKLCTELALNTRINGALPLLSPRLYLHILVSQTHQNKVMCDIFVTLYYSAMYFFYSDA
jgi:hypothetical protein